MVLGKKASIRKNYSVKKEDYTLLEEIGNGVSATVYRAIHTPSNEVVAIKCLDLDRIGSNLDDIRREAQTMSLIDHSNVVRAFCSFVVDRSLWVVMPFLSEGSCLHLMKAAYSNGFDEPVIASILKETLKALEYLHRHGHIHRDVKAGNILLDNNGTVKLGDFGVSACMFDKGDRQRARNTFVGTPCWMAPEVLQPGSGYDFKADIWSFGITALELAHGHAPFSKYPPMKVLLMTLQNAPPGLDYDRDRRFSKSFKEMVAMCLVKDQTRRPPADKLLKHSFFRSAKPSESTVKQLFLDLPPLWDRVKTLQQHDAAQLALKKMPSAEREALSQSEYKRGVSAWNFDVEDLKRQAELVKDGEEAFRIDEVDEYKRPQSNNEASSSYQSAFQQSTSPNNTVYRENASSVNSFQGTTLETLSIGRSDDSGNNSPSNVLRSPSSNDMDKRTRGKLGDDEIQVLDNLPRNNGQPVASRVLSPSSSMGVEDESHSISEKPVKPEIRKVSSLSGPLALPGKASMNSFSAPMKSSAVEEKSKANLVQIRGRFSVTPGEVDIAKESLLRKSASVGEWRTNGKSMDLGNSAIPVTGLVPHLQTLLQQTQAQQDLIVKLISGLQQNESSEGKPVSSHGSEATGEAAGSDRERYLLSQIDELHARVSSLNEELSTERRKHVLLQQQHGGQHGHGKVSTIDEEKED